MALRMRRSFIFFFLCVFIFDVNGQTPAPLPEGFINLDCGLNEGETRSIMYSSGFFMQYIPDDKFVENGIKEGVDRPPVSYESGSALLNTKRSFPGGNGTRGCYTFPVTKGLSILLRAYFYYGGHEGSSPPKFDVYLGVNHWETVEYSSYKLEIIHFPTSKYLHLCLLNTGNGDPYINYIELRPIGSPSRHIYNANGLGSLQSMYYDGNSGSCWSATYATIRYPDDIFDRIWDMTMLLNSTISTEFEMEAEDEYNPPWKAIRSARIADNNTQISFNYTHQDTIYVVLHFAELESAVRRYMSVTTCNSFVCNELQSLVSPQPLRVSSYPFILTAPCNLTISTSDQQTPPILNAMEEYKIILFKSNETNDDDVDAIRAIKDNYKDAFKAKWIGDPCLPQNQTWRGINCTYNGNEPPRITELNLSSLGLSGTIPQALANLPMLKKLDLSFNNLSGTIPDFLSHLENLKFISLEGNNMTWSWPSDLLYKWEHGLITLKGDVQNESHSHEGVNIGLGVIIAIAISIVVALICISLVGFLIVKSRSKQSNQENAKSPSHTERESSITPKLKPLTIYEVNNLIHDKIVLGQGGFGTVYLSSMDGNYVAVKILDECNEKQARDFKSEVEILSSVHHKNVVKILGYCDHKEKRALIMEYVDNNTLKHHLSAKNADGVLSWDTRVNIIIGAAQGLEYLHHGCKPPIIHRDIKPENILLTKDFEAKLADFGFSRLLTSQYNTSRLVGTRGYLDTMCLESLDKADVYSFGIVLLVVVTGKLPILPGHVELSHWVKEHVDRGNIKGIVDPHLDGQYDENMVWTIVEIAMKCISISHSKRPTMEDVVKDLKSAMESVAETNKSTILFFSESSDIHGPKSR